MLFLDELSNSTCALKHLYKFVASWILIFGVFSLSLFFREKCEIPYITWTIFLADFFFFNQGRLMENVVSQGLAGEHSFSFSPFLIRGHLYILKIFRFCSPFHFIPLTRFWRMRA